MDHSNRRRWLISAAIVLLLHAGIVVGVLTWRHVALAPPVLIDLTPAPSASEQNAAPPAPPVAEQTTPQQTTPEQKTESASASASTSASAFTSGGDHAEPVAPSEQAAPANEAAAKNEQSTGPAQVSPGVNAPQLPPSPQGTEQATAAESGAAGGTVIGGGVPRSPAPGGLGERSVATRPAATGSAVPGPVASAPAPTGLMPGSPMANMPLDTSITVGPPVYGPGAPGGPFANSRVGPLANREVGPFDRGPSTIFRPAKPFGVPDVPRNSLLPNGNSVLPNNNSSLPGIGLKNAPGARVQDRARAAMARAMSRVETEKNAIGSAVTSGAAANNAQRGDRNLPNGAAASGIGTSTTTIASRGDSSGLNGNSVTRNAIGVTVNFRPRIPRAGESKTGAVAVAGHEMPMAPIINGHDLARPMAGPGVIGGPARRGGAGVLSGTDFHLRHP